VDRVDDIKLSQFASAGGRSTVRIDGRLIGSYHTVDPRMLPGQDYATCLRLRDGAQEICYPVRTIVDIHDIPEKLDMACNYDQIAGLALVEGEQIEVIDAFALFASLERDDSGQSMRQCVIDNPDDNWNRDILAPLLRQAGYDVLFDPTQATGKGHAVMICTSQSPARNTGPRLPIVRLRPGSEPAGPDDTSVYRYDR
jgi:two-component system chemotaxis sensor kinase CheA